MRKTIRKVTIVVPVLMRSCQVSLNPNSGPVIAHTATTATAKRKVAGRPEIREVATASLANQLPFDRVAEEEPIGRFARIKISLCQLILVRPGALAQLALAVRRLQRQPSHSSRPRQLAVSWACFRQSARRVRSPLPKALPCWLIPNVWKY